MADYFQPKKRILDSEVSDTNKKAKKTSELVPVTDSAEVEAPVVVDQVVAMASQATQNCHQIVADDTDTQGETIASESESEDEEESSLESGSTTVLEETWSKSQIGSVMDLQTALVEFFGTGRGKEILNNVSKWMTHFLNHKDDDSL